MTSEPNSLPGIASGQVEIWKKIVDVQQHFNDLELRIRNFALIVTGAFLGLGGYAIKDGGVITLFGHVASIAELVVFSAILPLFAFYFMDRFWYHRLLEGAVNAGKDAEAALKALGYQIDLGTQISEASPFTLWPTKWRIHSKTKMDMFYGMLVLTLLAVAACLGFGVRPQLTTGVQTSSAAASDTTSEQGKDVIVQDLPSPAVRASVAPPVPKVTIERPTEQPRQDPAAKEPATQ